ncbi:MAG: TIGR02147 family protein [Deltaproteobacteria bacterium]|nr:TIGR02147 family protein [Deltaproteobacteria bacterium]
MIYEYNNIRDFLKAELQRRAQMNPLFSAAAFAKKLDISKAYLSLVLNNKRPPTKQMIEKISTLNILSDDEKLYMQLLIEKESSRASELEEFYTKKIKAFRKEKGITNLSLDLFQVLSAWQYSAILEAIHLDDLKEKTPQSIAKKLNLSLKTVRICSQKLTKLGLIKKDGKSFIRKDLGLLASPSDVHNKGLVHLHEQLLDKAKRALCDQAIEDRNITGMTIAIDPKKIPEAKQRIKKFTRELMQFLEDGKKTKVYQLNVQLFELRGEDNET